MWMSLAGGAETGCTPHRTGHRFRRAGSVQPRTGPRSARTGAACCGGRTPGSPGPARPPGAAVWPVGATPRKRPGPRRLRAPCGPGRAGGGQRAALGAERPWPTPVSAPAPDPGCGRSTPATAGIPARHRRHGPGPRFLPRSRRGRRVRVSRLPGVADGPWHCEPTVFAGPDGGAVVIVFSSLQSGPPASGVPSGFHHCGCPRLSIITGQAFPACFWPCRLPGQWAG